GLCGPVPFTIQQYRSAEMAERISRVARSWNAQIIYFDSLHTAQYRETVPLLAAILDEHNVESMVWHRVASCEENPLRRQLLRQQARLLQAYEAERCRVMDHVLCCSREDSLMLRSMAGLPWGSQPERLWIVSNGADLQAYSGEVRPAHLAGRPLVFVGSMDWAPNDDGARWFAREIMPRILEVEPSARFYVVGRNPGAELQSLHGQNGVVVVGEVADVRPYVLAAEVIPVPLRSGGGTRLKILEALGAGKPVVSTTVGAEGLVLTPGKEIEIADHPERFARVVISLLKDEKRRKELGEAGSQIVRTSYSWERIGQELAERIAALERKRTPLVLPGEEPEAPACAMQQDRA
ncbi:MAG: glycosyltransferase, partial [Deltaproteobacteria bacterium]|nr:glycosyltransferase [Deltaproteobacteria bacterium]